jgi:hypothetical protein
VDDQAQIGGSAREDAKIESALLQYVLALHPARATLDDLRREFDDQPGDFAGRDALERAVRDLSGAGLLQRSGDIVLPTRAALRFDELLGG